MYVQVIETLNVTALLFSSIHSHGKFHSDFHEGTLIHSTFTKRAVVQ